MALTRLGPNQAVNLSTNTTGTLGVANGGTGLTSGTTDQLLKFTGSTTLASSAISTGKVGQIIQGTRRGEVTTTSSTFTAFTDLSASITPTATSSKVLVEMEVHCHTAAGKAAFMDPNAEVFVDETTEKITWLNGTTEITMSDIKTKQAELQAKVDNGEDVGDI
jgi:hypothetical protein